MELQVKTAMQMRDQGHALKQKALDLVSEAEQKVGKSRTSVAGATAAPGRGRNDETLQLCFAFVTLLPATQPFYLNLVLCRGGWASILFLSCFLSFLPRLVLSCHVMPVYDQHL